MRIGGNRGVRLPDYKEAVLSHGIETPEPAEPLFLPVPEEQLTQIQPGDRLSRGQFLWENDCHLPVYCPADGVVAALDPCGRLTLRTGDAVELCVEFGAGAELFRQTGC